MTGPRLAERRWTPGEEKQLLEMLKAGKTAVEISREINRTPGAIYTCSGFTEGDVLHRLLPPSDPKKLLSSSTSGEPGTKPFS